MSEIDLQLHHFKLKFLVLNKKLLILEIIFFNCGLGEDVTNRFTRGSRLMMFLCRTGQTILNGKGFSGMLHDGDDFKGLRMVICTLFITMNKNIGQGHWGNY